VQLPAGVTGRFAYAGKEQQLQTGVNALTW
jgi:hypothetical protein